MFVGHLAVALGAKRMAPGVPLGATVAAAFGLDLIWPVLLLLGAETVRVSPGDTAFTNLAFDAYPRSHRRTGPCDVGSHPINLAVRFLLELAALFSMGVWGWRTGEGWQRFVLAALIPAGAAVLRRHWRERGAPVAARIR